RALGEVPSHRVPDSRVGPPWRTARCAGGPWCAPRVHGRARGDVRAMVQRWRLPARYGLALMLMIPGATGGGVAETLTVGASAPSPGQCALMMARDSGLFRAQDLDVDLVFFDSGTEALQGLVGGRTPIVAVGASALVNAALAGADAVLIAGFV